jgi:hypothetical protein
MEPIYMAKNKNQEFISGDARATKKRKAGLFLSITNLQETLSPGQ